MPGTGNAVWDIIVALIGLVAALAAVAGVVRGGQRTSRDAVKARDSPLTPTWGEMWSEMRRLREDFDELRIDHLDLKARMGAVEQDRDALGDGLRVIAEWDDAGRPDPPGFPGIAAHARRVLDRMHSN